MSLETQFSNVSVLDQEVARVRSEAEKVGRSPGAAERSFREKAGRATELIKEARREKMIRSLAIHIQSELKKENVPDSPEETT